MSKPKVLVVDNDCGVLRFVADALSIQGYEVHAAYSPGQALELVKAIPCFDLLVSDVIMPEMCGPELVRKIKQICPSIAVVMMSGHISGQDVPSGAGFINKPFLLTDLYSVVEKTLARSAA
jgi:two-component system cell cycle sensor histidine kinase/response regulator CckA